MHIHENKLTAAYICMIYSNCMHVYAIQYVLYVQHSISQLVRNDKFIELDEKVSVCESMPMLNV